MPAIDFKSALGNPTSIDHANIEIQGTRVSRTIKLGLFTTNENAVRAGDYLLSKESYPIAKVQFTANRKVFRLLPGDPFVFKFPKYGIDQMVCRVVMIEEEDVESEKITITAVEESTHATKPVSVYTEPDNYRVRRPSQSVGVLTPVTVIEAPYALVNESMHLIFLVPRITGNETGFWIYMSQDGEEYYQLYRSSVYSVYGTLAYNYGITPWIDDYEGMYIDFGENQRTERLETISRAELMGTRNAALIGDEIITFQTVTPITATQYKLTGVYRGRWGTLRKEHTAGENFYFIGSSYQSVTHYSFLVGSTRYFKLVPFSSRSSGSLSAAEVLTHTFTGEAWKPYEVINLAANGESVRPTYDEENIVLTWDSRVRGEGTGIGDPSVVIDSTQSWEGLFRAKFYVGGSLMRTKDDLDALTCTYTTSEILADNGHYPSYITARVTNFIEGAGGVEYESDPTDLVIRKPVITTTTTTTTSTTSSTT